jgi:sugar phosphate isomerase/epimerase
MTLPISIQLYTVREQMAEDFPGTIAKIAQFGYAGVEPAGFPEGVSASEAAKVFSDNGLVVSAYQGGTPVGEDRNRLLDEAEVLGTKHVVCSYYDREKFSRLDDVKQTAELFSEAIANAAQRGMTFGYHNHEFEMQLIDGKPALLHLAERTGPRLYNTVDTYWVKVGGQDPVEVVRALGERANLLHIKDGPGQKEAPMLAAGQGVMDFPPIVHAAEHAAWLVVELDQCATDMIEAVRQSFDYLTSANLGHGKA